MAEGYFGGAQDPVAGAGKRLELFPIQNGDPAIAVVNGPGMAECGERQVDVRAARTQHFGYETLC